jgi:BASS family bile acid:Na+ symporter
MGGPIPEWLLSALAAATLFAVMSSVGLGIVAGELRGVLRRPGLLLRGLATALVAMPLVAIGVTRALGVDRVREIGIVLMAVSPGAPLALRNALAAGGHRGFAAALQLAIALLAVLSMPLWIAVLNRVYAGHAAIAPLDVARQVLAAQIVPLALGMALRSARPELAARLEPWLAQIGNVLLAFFFLAAALVLAAAAAMAEIRVAAAVCLTTAVALALGHALGGPDPAVRTAVGVTVATRNAGLALLVASLNAAPTIVRATVVAYIVFSLPLVLAYLAWRRRVAASG